jgi:hypothetical protein
MLFVAGLFCHWSFEGTAWYTRAHECGGFDVHRHYRRGYLPAGGLLVQPTKLEGRLSLAAGGGGGDPAVDVYG